MKYEDLLAMAKRAASIAPEAPCENLLDVVQLVTTQHGPQTRAYASDRLMFLFAEFIEEPSQQALRSTKH